MTRAQRIAVISTIITALYLLTFFEFLRVPLVEGAVVQEILPVVGNIYSHYFVDAHVLQFCSYPGGC